MIRSVVIFLVASLTLLAFRSVLAQAEKMKKRVKARSQSVRDPRQIGTLRRDPVTGVYEVAHDR